MVNFSQRLVVYHGCGNSYQDGTRKIVPNNRRCITRFGKGQLTFVIKSKQEHNLQ